MDASKRIRITTIVFALLAGIGILVLKFYAARISNSSALRSDALEGTVNVLAAAFGLAAILFAEKPADQDHPYGHGKIEYFAAAFEGGLIALAGVLILIDAVSRLLGHANLQDLSRGFQLNLIAGALNGGVGFLVYSVGKKHHSETLRADGIHLITDLATTIGLALGILLIFLTGWTWLDPVLAIGVSLLLFRTGLRMLNRSSKALLDAENPELLQQIVDVLNRTDRKSIITVHELKAQDFGREKHIDLHLVVPEFISIKEAHDLTDAFAVALVKPFRGTQVHTHIDPCEQDYCEECPLPNCSIRKKTFIQTEPFTVETITRPGRQ